MAPGARRSMSPSSSPGRCPYRAEERGGSPMCAHRAGPHFLQMLGPSNVPGRILRAIESPTMEHRGTEFHAVAKEVLAKGQPNFRTENPVVIIQSQGTGARAAQ